MVTVSVRPRGLLVGELLVTLFRRLSKQAVFSVELIPLARVHGDDVSAVITGWPGQRRPTVAMVIGPAV